MTLSAAPVPSANAERLATETPAANVASHHLTVFADGDDSPSFKDFLDIINPLQHIPIINTIYREITGDQPGALARVAGGALYGGVIGMALEATDAVIDDETGKDVGEHIWAFLTGDDSDPGADSGTKVAQDQSNPAAATTPPQTAQTAAPELAALSSAGESQPPPLSGAGLQPTVTNEPLAPPPVAASNAAKPQPLTAMAEIPPDQGQIKMSSRFLNSAAASEARPSETDAKALPRGFMPVPPRMSTPIAPMPPLHIPITTSSQNSNIPVTGRPIPNTNLNRDAVVPPMPVPPKPVAASAVPSPVAPPPVTPPPVTPPPVNSQTSLTAQQIALQNQPLPPSSAPGQWFPSAMASALDKYEQMNKLGRATTSNIKVSTAKAAGSQTSGAQTASVQAANPSSDESITFAP